MPRPSPEITRVDGARVRLTDAAREHILTQTAEMEDATGGATLYPSLALALSEEQRDADGTLLRRRGPHISIGWNPETDLSEADRAAMSRDGVVLTMPLEFDEGEVLTLDYGERGFRFLEFDFLDLLERAGFTRDGVWRGPQDERPG